MAKKRQGEKVEIAGRELEITNLDKIYWPEENITKGEMIDYYRRIAPTLLPYLKDRPENLNRYPRGITGKRFFQKDVSDAPGWAKTVQIESESTGKPVNYLVCQDEAALVYIANLGTVEINPWNSRVGSLEHPDYLVIDLDPEGPAFGDVVRVALSFHEVLEELKIPNFIKTSGKTGLHLFIPLAGKPTYEQARELAQRLSQLVHGSHPDLTSLERSPKKRQGKIYLDYLQNGFGQTMAAPYSLRPRPGAPVSTPLKWEEVRPGLDPTRFTILTIFERIEALGDLWQGVLGPGIDLKKMEKGFERLETSNPKLKAENSKQVHR